MRKNNRKNQQCCNEKEQKNLEFAREIANGNERRDEKDCGGGCGKR